MDYVIFLNNSPTLRLINCDWSPPRFFRSLGCESLTTVTNDWHFPQGMRITRGPRSFYWTIDVGRGDALWPWRPGAWNSKESPTTDFSPKSTPRFFPFWDWITKSPHRFSLIAGSLPIMGTFTYALPPSYTTLSDLIQI